MITVSSFRQNDKNFHRTWYRSKPSDRDMRNCLPFVAYYKNAFNNHSMSGLSGDFLSSNSLPTASASDSGPHKAATHLGPSKSGGFDGIPALIIKVCSGILITVLKFIFNLRLSQRISPTFWKQADFVPVFKKRKTALVNNYRPISIPNTFSEIFKIITHEQVSHNLKSEFNPLSAWIHQI